MANAEGFNVKGLDFSPIKGGEGNIEFLAWLERSDTDQGVIEENVDTQKVIDSAYSNLNS
jgi:23S rRNA (cytidine1920-2'-O)/16S rRNA (cytidine1409-2'-O)-methyltransferase